METMQPVPFVVLDGDKFVLRPEACEFLARIEGRVSVVAVAGAYRTGKSFILNQLTGNSSPKSGFAIGSTVNACTKGLWIWGQREQSSSSDGSTLTTIFIDTEGIGSPDATLKYDLQIFSFAVLLSSLFIYNGMGTIDESALDRLSLVAKLTEAIDAKSEFAAEFPSFLWLLRDFSLQLVDANGDEMSEREYLEKVRPDLQPLSTHGVPRSTVALG